MDYKIVIDAGHGGTDPGAVGNGIVEKDLNLKIANMIYERLKELDIPVKIIRDTDETVSPDERVKRVLNAFGDEKDVIVISNHINAGGGDGAEVIYALRNNDKLSNLILNELELAGQNIRKAYQRRLPSDPSKDYYFMHRNTGNTEPVIVEYGFIDSTGDDVNQLKKDYAKYVEAVVKAITKYIGAQYKPADGKNIYIVQAGDSLYSISKKYNTSVDKLKELNNLTSNLLKVGQMLTIPSISEEIKYITYTVFPGDTLYSIAKKYNTTVEKIMNLNNFANTILNIGEELKIPVDYPEEVLDYIIYIVSKGDSLYGIAKKYNTSINDLMELNGLKTNMLNIGQQLKIPNNLSDTYIVKAGDSLYSIAKKYNTTVDILKDKNNLNSNLLSIGQILKI